MTNESQSTSDAEIVERLEKLKQRMVPQENGSTKKDIMDHFSPLRIGAAVAVILLFGAAIWLAYSSGSDVDDSVPPPIIRADNSPTKVPPDEPGGLDVADQDMLVFDRLKDGQVEYEEQLLPLPEEPVDISRDRMALLGGDEEPVQTTDVPLAPEPAVVAPSAAMDIAATEPAEAEPAVPEVEPVTPLPPPPPAKLPDEEAGAAYAVQLAALGSEEAAESAWEAYVSKLPGLLARQDHYVATLERSGQKTLYRLRTGAFSGRQDADLFCDTLKRQGQDCMVVRR